MKCRYCSAESVFFRKISSEALCKEHFIISIEKKIRKTIRKYTMFTPNEKVVVGLSGGKDSLTLLFNIVQIQRQYSFSPEVEAILIDEGIKSYRAESLEIAKEFCNNLNVPLHIVPFRTNFGSDLDNLIEKLREFKTNPCTVCGTVRRRLLNDKALELKADKLAIGHNLDDVSETLLQNVLRNDLDKIFSNPPYGNPIDPEHHFVSRIKPLMEVPETEIMLYCYYKGFSIQATPCPYASGFDILRKKVLDFLNLIEQHSAEIKFNLLHFNTNLLEKYAALRQQNNLDKDFNPNPLCGICNAPMGEKREICYYCELRKKFGLI